MPPTATTASPIAQQRQFLTLLKTVLDRAYQDGVDQFYNWKVDGDTISGVFRDDNQGYKFSLSASGLTYNPVGNKRSDSDIEGSTLANSALRFDGAKAKKCKGTTTYACGGACLPNKKTCRINGKNVVTAQEMKTLTTLGSGLSKPRFADAKVFKSFDKPLVDLNPKPQEPGQPKPAKKELNEMSIRELRSEAQARGVPGYSHVDKDTLNAMITSWDKEPEAQKRIVKTIERRTKQRQSDPFNEFKRFFGLKKVLGTGSVITAAMILNIGVHSYNGIKDRYRGEFSTSADAAKERAKGVNVDKVPETKEYITFAVDRMGAHNTGTLEKELLASDPKVFKKHHFVTIGSDVFEEGDKVTPNPLVPGPLKETFETYQAVSKRLHSQIIRGRDPQAIELAAQVLQYSKRYPDKQINLIGDHDGGMVVNEAAEIILKANKDIAHNLRIVNLGTPHFGLTDVVTSDRQGATGRTITVSAAEDPSNMFPKMNNQQINSIRSGSVKDYLKDEHAQEVIRGGVGYYDETSDPAVRFARMTWHPEHPYNDPIFATLTYKQQEQRIAQFVGNRLRDVAKPTPAKAREQQAQKAAVPERKRYTKNEKRRNTTAANKVANAAAQTPPSSSSNPSPTPAATPKPKGGGGGGAQSGGGQAATPKPKGGGGNNQPPPAATASNPTPKTKGGGGNQSGGSQPPAATPPPPAAPPIGEPVEGPVEVTPNQPRRSGNPRSLADRDLRSQPPAEDPWESVTPAEAKPKTGKGKGKGTGKSTNKDAIDLTTESSAYREAFQLTARRFRRV